MKTFTLSQSQIVKQNFESYFGISFGPFYDGLMSAITKSIKIDIMKFDEFLHEKYGMYEDKKESMKTIIIKNYGKEAEEFIESLI